MELPKDSVEILPELIDEWRPQFISLFKSFVYSRRKNNIARQNSRILPAAMPWIWEQALEGKLVSDQEIKNYILGSPDYRGVLDEDGNPIDEHTRNCMFGATDERIVECRSHNFFVGYMREVNAFVHLSKKGRVFRSNFFDLKWDVDIILVDEYGSHTFAVRHHGAASIQHERERKSLQSYPGVVTLRAAESSTNRLDIFTKEEVENGVKEARQRQASSSRCLA